MENKSFIFSENDNKITCYIIYNETKRSSSRSTN